MKELNALKKGKYRRFSELMPDRKLVSKYEASLRSAEVLVRYYVTWEHD